MCWCVYPPIWPIYLFPQDWPVASQEALLFLFSLLKNILNLVHSCYSYICAFLWSATMENASSLYSVGLTDGQSEPQSIQSSFLFDPITSPLFGSVLVLTVLLVQPEVKDNCLWSSSWDGMSFCSKYLTPTLRQNFGSGAYFKACVKLYVMLIKMESCRVNWRPHSCICQMTYRERPRTNGRL